MRGILFVPQSDTFDRKETSIKFYVGGVLIRDGLTLPQYLSFKKRVGEIEVLQGDIMGMIQMALIDKCLDMFSRIAAERKHEYNHHFLRGFLEESQTSHLEEESENNKKKNNWSVA